MACVMHGLGQTRREAQRTGTGRVDIVSAGVALESIASVHHIAPRCGRRLRRAAATWQRHAAGIRLLLRVGVLAPRHRR
jgi:transposase